MKFALVPIEGRESNREREQPMKIEKTQIIQPTSSQNTGVNEKTTGNSSFESVLSEQIQSTSKQMSMPIGRLPSRMEIQFSETENVLKDTVDVTGKLIDAMDQYGALLGDPKQNLKTVALSVEKMTQTLEQLNRLVEKLPDEKPLQQVVEDVRSLAKKEVDRFFSGYYVDP